MKFTCILCVLLLVVSGISWGIYAFTGFNALLFFSFGSQVAYKSLLAVNAVAALFTVYSLLAFKPFRHLK